jgi:hypothetical protein
MALDIEGIQEAVVEAPTPEKSVVVLVEGFYGQINELVKNSGNSVNPSTLKCLIDQWEANKEALAMAVTNKENGPVEKKPQPPFRAPVATPTTEKPIKRTTA